MHVTYRFNETDQGSPVDLHYHHGTPAILEQQDLAEKGNNTLFIGDGGMLLCGFSQRQLLPEEKFTDFTAPDPFIPDSPGFHDEWISACKGGGAATCNFDYSGPMAETVLLSNVAYRGGGFDWNPQTLETGGNKTAQALIRESYRKGWEI